MTFFDTHVLSVILFTPLAGALILLFIGREKQSAIRWIANATAVLGFLVSVPLWFRYDPQGSTWQFAERMGWIPSIGAEYYLGVDGFSILLILLTTLMGAIAVLSSWTGITERLKDTTSSCSSCRRACSAPSWRSTSCCSSCSGK